MTHRHTTPSDRLGLPQPYRCQANQSANAVLIEQLAETVSCVNSSCPESFNKKASARKTAAVLGTFQASHGSVFIVFVLLSKTTIGLGCYKNSMQVLFPSPVLLLCFQLVQVCSHALHQLQLQHV